MGCISIREKEDYGLQAIEAQLELFLFSIDNIRNGFFYLNDGNNISEERLNNGFTNMQNLISNFLAKYTRAEELFKKFILPFKQPDESYQYREILICLYLNSRSKSVEKAKAIAELLTKNKEELNLDEIKDIFQKMFSSVLLYSFSLADQYLVPKKQPVEEEQKKEHEEEAKTGEQNDEMTEIKEKKEEKLGEEKKEEEKKEEKKEEEKKEEKKEEEKKEEEKKEEKKEEEKKEEKKEEKPIEKVINPNIEQYLQLGEKIANTIAESFVSLPDEKIKINDFAEKCKSHIPTTFGRDIMYPKGIRLSVYHDFDKQKQ